MGDLTISEVVAESVSRAKNDATYVGSVEHRNLLERYLGSNLPNTAIKWLAPGERSYYDPASATLGLETPTAGGAEHAEAAAAIALHEVGHAQYVGDVGLEYRQRVGMLPRPELRGVVEFIFNHLEDARVATRQLSDDSSCAPLLAKLAEEAVRQASLPPATRRERFLNALLERIHVGAVADVLEPEVQAALDDCEPFIVTAVQGETSDSGLEALKIVRVYLDARLD